MSFSDGPEIELPAGDVTVGVGRLVRRLHDASMGFAPPPRRTDPQRPQPLLPEDEPRIFAQRDVTPQNTVFRDGDARGLIDFDLCDWTTRSVDLANTAMHWVPLCDPVDREGGHALVDVAARVRLMLDGYGCDRVSAARFLHAAQLRFAGSHAIMKWNADNVGGGWRRMGDEGVGDVIRRRLAWFDAVRDELAGVL